MKKLFNLVGGISIVALSVASFTFAYTQEEQEAYEWAYKYGITTQPTIDAANLDGNITRQAFSKMVINFLEKAIGIEESTLKSCSFPDENKITTDLVPYTKKTCAYGIMGKDGTKFNPTQSLDKAQLGTVLSRIIWGDEYNNNGKWYYIYHLNMLKSNGIMDNIDNPTETYVKRGDVLIMLKRINDKFNSNTDINDTNTGLENEDIILDGEKIVYYDNGKIAVKMNFKNGKKDGIWESYYENGQLKEKANYKNGEFDGEQFSYYENGQLRSKGYFKNGYLNGDFVYYYENGNLGLKDFYKDGNSDGEQLIYYENGQLKSKGNFNNGNPDGKMTSYYENGQVYTIGNYKNGIGDGEQLEYYENGKIKAKGYFKDGEPDGEFVAYYENGQLKEKTKYKNGGLDGEIIAYYEDGKLKGRGNYKDGKGNGKFIYYYEDEQVSLEINLKDGLLDGKYTHYFKDGKITEMNYKNGKEDGKQIGYYEDESLRFLHNFKDGVGTKSYFDKEGNLIGTGTEIFTDEINENEGIYKSILNGLEILYYDNGQAYEISNYKDGKLDGTQTLYYENGQISSICNYVNGIVIGDCTMYNESGEEITGYSDNYGPNILPDSAKIEVGHDRIIVGEATDLKVTIMKSDSPMKTYKGTIRILVTDLNGNKLKDNEYTVPSQGLYTFQGSDLGTKEFQRGLEIKKEGKFYIEIQDINDNEEKVLGRQAITVIKA